MYINIYGPVWEALYTCKSLCGNTTWCCIEFFKLSFSLAVYFAFCLKIILMLLDGWWKLHVWLYTFMLKFPIYTQTTYTYAIICITLVCGRNMLSTTRQIYILRIFVRIRRCSSSSTYKIYCSLNKISLTLHAFRCSLPYTISHTYPRYAREYRRTQHTCTWPSMQGARLAICDFV